MCVQVHPYADIERAYQVTLFLVDPSDRGPSGVKAPEPVKRADQHYHDDDDDRQSVISEATSVKSSMSTKQKTTSKPKTAQSMSQSAMKNGSGSSNGKLNLSVVGTSMGSLNNLAAAGQGSGNVGGGAGRKNSGGAGGFDGNGNGADNGWFATKQSQQNQPQQQRPQQQQQQQQPVVAFENDYGEESAEEDYGEALSDLDGEEFEGDGEAGSRALGGKPAHRTAQRFSANRPWAGAIVAPTKGDEMLPKGDLPSETLILEHVHGYRTRDVRNNLFYLANGCIVFPAGAVGVVHDPRTNRQRFFQGRHKEDITAVAVHPSGRLVATGDIVCHDDGCYVYIWDADNPEDEQKQIQLKIGDKKLAKGVADVEFSPDGRYLTVVAMDADHMVYLYDWQKNQRPIAKEKGHTDAIFGVTFNHSNPSEFVTYGVKHLKYWQWDPSSSRLKGDRGLFGSRKVQSVICATFLPNGNFVTGSHGGELLVWSRNQIVSVIDGAHKGPVYGLAFGPAGLISGGKDGKVVLRDAKLHATDEVELESGVRALCLSADGNKVLVGLEDSVIVEVEGIGKGRNKKQMRIMEAHSAAKMEELWGLSVNPNNDNEFVTCGDDGQIFRWDADQRKPVASATLAGKLRAISYSPDGSVIAIGNDAGDIYVVQAEDLAQVFYQKYKQRKNINSKLHGIDVIKFSPNGMYIAVGSHDCVVDIYDVAGGMKLAGVCKGHSSYITHLDWSADSQYLQTNSADFELLFWSAPSGKQITSATAMKDVEWATYSCILGWPVQGIWEKGMDGTDINTANRNPESSCIASGDDFMNVRLHVYPAVKENLPCKKFLGHGSHVTKVIFTPSGKRLISTGGLDGCTFQLYEMLFSI
ncbi:Echinoderm microtubule-associated protein-like 5 [Quaeritorhiza haematococci]|nr:Echinoderm microtubule-associated protein-like 5 [Quaeritorhiza haematococci]